VKDKVLSENTMNMKPTILGNKHVYAIHKNGHPPSKVSKM